MKNKILKKIVGIFGYKLADKNYIKNNRLLEASSYLNIEKVLNFLFSKKKMVCAKILKDGDLILLASGGHGFKAITNVSFFEVKQGPYSPKKDKVIFESKLLK